MMKCYYCGKEVYKNDWQVVIKEAVKPPDIPYRYKKLGVAHFKCVEGKTVIFDKYKYIKS